MSNSIIEVFAPISRVIEVADTHGPAGPRGPQGETGPTGPKGDGAPDPVADPLAYYILAKA